MTPRYIDLFPWKHFNNYSQLIGQKDRSIHSDLARSSSSDHRNQATIWSYSPTMFVTMLWIFHRTTNCTIMLCVCACVWVSAWVCFSCVCLNCIFSVKSSIWYDELVKAAIKIIHHTRWLVLTCIIILLSNWQLLT